MDKRSVEPFMDLQSFNTTLVIRSVGVLNCTTAGDSRVFMDPDSKHRSVPAPSSKERCKPVLGVWVDPDTLNVPSVIGAR